MTDALTLDRTAIEPELEAEHRNAPSAEPVAAPPPRRRLSRNPLIAAAIAIVVALAGFVWLNAPGTSETTDNAYLKADSTVVAPRVAGLVTQVLVRDNQSVRTGQPLLRIDTQQFDSRVAAAEASLADAVAGVATANAALQALGADQRYATAQVRAAATSIRSADAEYVRATADRDRFDTLLTQGFTTRRDAERVRAAAVGAASARERSLADRDVASRNADVTGARRPVLEAQLAAAQAEEAGARAELTLARQDRGYTLVRASVDGVVGDRQVQTGDYVQPGTRLLTLVPTEALYVVANFKETQTQRMRPGQAVTVYVDALEGEPLRGRVESFAPGSGSEFTLLPFEPGSGNFTKIVQRIGVRIALDRDQPALASLRPGLSVTAKVRLK